MTARARDGVDRESARVPDAARDSINITLDTALMVKVDASCSDRGSGRDDRMAVPGERPAHRTSGEPTRAERPGRRLEQIRQGNRAMSTRDHKLTIGWSSTAVLTNPGTRW
jgi:hypothetical protein